MHTIPADNDAVPGGSMNSPEIRLATITDAEDVFKLIEEYYETVGVVVRDDRETLLRYLQDPESAIWLARMGGEPAGCVVLRPLPGLPRAAEVKRMYVRSRFRKRGIAAELMHALEEHALTNGVEWLYLDTKDDLIAAIRFYEQRGFQRCERYNQNPQATIFMRKRLLNLEG